MKKIIHKLKKNRLVSKITCFSVILMILISSFTVSSFAADEEVSAANEEVNSITDTWTSVMNWITSSLGSAQGVFVSSGGSSFTLNSVDLVEVSVGSAVLYYVPLPDFSPDGAVLDSSYDFEFMGNSFNLIYNSESLLQGFGSADPDSILIARFLSSEGIPFPADTWVLILIEPFSGSATLVTPSFGSSGLTFLGTLSVVGVSIAVILLLISVVINFLKLRG